MKRTMVLIAMACLGLGVGNAFAAAPPSFDFFIDPVHETAVENVTFRNCMSFDYWYGGNTVPAGLFLNVRTQGFFPDNIFEPIVTIANVPLSDKPTNTWLNFTTSIPTSLFIDPTTGERRTGIREFFAFELSRSTPDTVYFKDLETFNGPCEQPVPEPGTWAMMAMGALSLFGFEIRRRKMLK